MYASKKEAWYHMRLAALRRPSSLLFPHQCPDYVDKWHISQQGPWNVYDEAKRDGDTNMITDRRSTTCRGARTGEFVIEYDSLEQAEKGILYVKHRFHHDMKAYQCAKCNSPPGVFSHERPMVVSRRPTRRFFSSTRVSSLPDHNITPGIQHNPTQRSQSCNAPSSTHKWWIILLWSSSVSLGNVMGFPAARIPYSRLPVDNHLVRSSSCTRWNFPTSSAHTGTANRSFRTPFHVHNRHGTASMHRLFSSRDASNYEDEWKVPSTVRIPEESLEMSFVRSSGAGGQNVNKVATSVQIKVLVDGMGWIPYEVRDRLKKNEAKRINKEGYLVFQVQEYRTQAQNRKAAVDKLREMILLAWPRPKQRKMRTGLSPKTKKKRREDKRKRSMVKEGRRKVDF